MSPILVEWAWRLLAAGVLVVCVAWLFKKHDPPRVLLALGGALMSVGARWTDVQSYIFKGAPESPRPWLLSSGFILLVVGVAWLVVPRTVQWFRELGTELGAERFRCRVARSEDLPRIRKFAVSFFGEGVSSAISMRQWHKRYNRLFWILEDNKRSFKPLEARGYYCLIPLTDEAATLVEAEELDGTTLTRDHIEPVSERVAALYVGGIAARGFFAKGSILNHLDGRLTDFDARGIPVYSRPVTDDGLRLLKKNGFKPVDSSVGEHDLDRMYKRLPAAASTSKG